MAGKGYDFYQRQYHSRDTDLQILAATDDSTVITVKNANYRLYVQRIKVTITTYSAKTWLFTDSTGTPIPLAFISIAAAAEAHVSESASIIFDFGPKGYPLGLGKNLLLDVSAVGAAGQISVEAYEKLDTVISHNAVSQ